MPRLARPSAISPQAPDWWQRAVLTLALLLVGVLPLLYDTSLLEPFRALKREVAAGLWAGLAALFVARNLRGTAWRDPWLLPFLAVLAGAVLSAPFSGWPLRVLLAAVPFALATLGVLALRQLQEAQRLLLLRVTVLAGVVQALATMLFVVPSWRPDSYQRLADLEARYAWIGTLGNPADVAVFLALPFLIAVAQALQARRRRVGNALAAAVMAPALVGTQTLSVLAALGVALAVLLLHHVPARRRLAVAAVGTALVVAVATLTPLRGRLAEAASYVRWGQWVWLGSGRTAGFTAGLGMVLDHPVTGAGFGQFEACSYRYQSEELLAERSLSLGLETGFGEAHNELLQHAAETGLLGLALLGAGLALAIRRGPPASDTLSSRLPLLLAAGTIAMAQFPLHQAAPAALWAVLAALALPRLEPPPLPRGRRGLATAAAVLAGTGLAAAVVAARINASLAFQQGQQLAELLRRGTPAVKVAPARSALGRLTPRLRWRPYDFRAVTILGNLAMDAGDDLTARRHFARAVALADRPELHFNLAMALLSAGEEPAALDQLVRAVKQNPTVVRELARPEVIAALRTRLLADGYLQRFPWVLGDVPP